VDRKPLPPTTDFQDRSGLATNLHHMALELYWGCVL